MKKYMKKSLAMWLAFVLLAGLVPIPVSAAGTTTLGSLPVGSSVTLNENGVPTKYFVVQQGKPSDPYDGKPSDLYDDSCNGTWLLRSTPVAAMPWDSYNRLPADYANSTIHRYLNSDFLALFDVNIQAIIKQVKVPYTATWNGTDYPVLSGSAGLSCKIFLLSGRELGDADNGDEYITTKDGEKLEYFRHEDYSYEKKAYFNGREITWWLRTGEYNFARCISKDGAYCGNELLRNCGVRPAFILPPTTLVCADGTVTVNTAPTTPDSISVPSNVNGGSSATISWGASTDAENNLAGYRLERSVDNGAWTQIYQGSALSTTNSVAFGTTSVMYRVKAYDSLGLESGVKTSSPANVINIAPYKVEHYQQNVGDDGYSLFETDSLKGRAGTMAASSAKLYTGFHENTGALDRVPSGQIALDGSLVLKLYYDRDTYTVTFDSNGGNAVPSQNGIRHEGLAVEPVAPIKTGYLFAKWYSDEELSTAYDFSSPVTDDFPLYAKWAPRTDTAYQVEHYRQNVEDDGYTRYETDQLQGTTDATVTATAKSYPGFQENTGTADRAASGAVAPDGSLVLKLYYDRDTYTVTFDSNGGNAVPSQNGIRYEGLAVEPVAPTKTGYLFARWCSDEGLSAAYDFSSPVTDSLTLYAKWAPRTDTPYQVEYYRQNVGDDGYTLYETDHLQGTTDAAMTATVKSYPGFHENTDSADRIASGTVAPDGSLVLKLYYDRDTYTVTFDSNGGNAVPSQNGIRCEGLAVEPVAPTKTGYLFAGWYSDEGLSAAYDFSSPVTDSLTLYAKWAPRTDTPYQVEHYRQNVEDDGYTLYETDQLHGTTDAAATATAKSYTGFHENTGAADQVPSGTVAPDGSLVLKLYYDRDTYTVTFDTNSGEMEPSAMRVTYGHAYGTLPIPTRTDYIFVGWYTAGDGGVNVTSDSIVVSGGDRTLYAQWVKESYGVLDGVVNDSDGNPVPGAAITIRAGNVDYKTTTADLDGRFTILAVKYGTYNLVAEKDGVTVTTMIAIQAEKVSQTITLPKGKTSSVVDVLGNAPELVVGGLNTLFDRSEVYTDRDETVVAGGGTVELRMTVEEKDAATLGEDAAQITLAASGMIPLYLDVKLTKNVISGDGSEVSTTLTELPQLLDIIIPLGNTDAEGLRIFRVHNGATDEITNTPNEYGEYFEVQGSSVMVHAGRFSTYAIATPDNSSDSSQYLIKATAGSGGTVTPETAWVSDGNSVTVRMIPNQGHSIQSVLVDGQEVGVVESYTFQTISKNHTLTATFFCPSEAYTDLDAGSWYHTAVDGMISHGYMLGIAEGRWEPNGSITRAQMAMILFKMKGANAGNPTGSHFEDVSLDAWYAGPVAWAVSSGVGVGYDENRFGPDDALTREQLALMLYQYAGEPTGQAEDSETIFLDRSQVSPWAETAVQWAVSAGLLQGDERKLLHPQGTCTRAEAAAILYRYLTEKNEKIGAGE